MQPLIRDEHGVIRFKANRIIARLFDVDVLDLNRIMTWDVPDEDRMQLAQLLGYSVGGYGELSYVTDESYEAAEKAAEEM